MSRILDRDDEFRQTVTAIYWAELGRAPDPGGLENWLQNARDGWTGDQIRQAIHDSPEAVQHRATPPPPPVPVTGPLHLEIRGANFVDANGDRIVLNGCDQFVAYRQFLDGVDLAPLFAESHELGFTMWRVFLMGSVRQNSILQLTPADAGFYNHLRPFADLLNTHEIILLATVFVDAQDILPNVAHRTQHWAQVADQLRGSLTLLSGGNEWGKNGWNPSELNDPGMLWSRGSDLSDKAPYKPYGSFAEFHPVRGVDRTLMDAVASPVYIRSTLGLTGPLVIDEPLGFAEVEQPGRRSADPFVAWQLGRLYGTMNGGAVFHNDAGMRGQLVGPITRACAEQWCRGMKT